MPTVLVVDDSPIDLRLVAGLIEQQPDFRTQRAGNGAEALELMADAEPDLVLTDLVMPEMDGLQLVEQVRQRHPLVPVVLMTSQGSEQISVEALQRGAASYVPKSSLGTDLLETLQNVLAVAREGRGRARLIDGLVHWECRFELENDGRLIPPLVGYLQDHLSGLEICDETQRIQVGVALEEALVNALYHGNLGIGSELREGDQQAYYELVRQRQTSEPYKHRRIRVQAAMSRGEAVFRISDEGTGFDPGQVPDPTDPGNLERASGRGLLLMRTFLDDVRFNDRGNEVTLVKRGHARNQAR